MDVALSYAVWLSQQTTDDNTLQAIFHDASSVLFSKCDHETRLVDAEAEITEPDVD
ncbi:hypothetical protein SAMN05660691_02840 [Rheinheimera pacifica]|uniref:Uncharacterized protein n=1 Tax=Rheinheimera pacifica TaxID=173990 RepID=A0A1H6MQP9_9GAMM|nr:hypothetical protein [Rheinheimera pacifica]SEI01733.1 hypothetical protein SAMN05660691_02840 [Rheinheimera pacifica]